MTFIPLCNTTFSISKTFHETVLEILHIIIPAIVNEIVHENLLQIVHEIVHKIKKKRTRNAYLVSQNCNEEMVNKLQQIDYICLFSNRSGQLFKIQFRKLLLLTLRVSTKGHHKRNFNVKST